MGPGGVGGRGGVVPMGRECGDGGSRWVGNMGSGSRWVRGGASSPGGSGVWGVSPGGVVGVWGSGPGGVGGRGVVPVERQVQGDHEHPVQCPLCVP